MKLGAHDAVLDATKMEVARKGGRLFDWSLPSDSHGCRDCKWSTVIEQSKAGHRLGCTHREVTKGEPLPIYAARQPQTSSRGKHVGRCGPKADLWSSRK